MCVGGGGGLRTNIWWVRNIYLPLEILIGATAGNCRGESLTSRTTTTTFVVPVNDGEPVSLAAIVNSYLSLISRSRTVLVKTSPGEEDLIVKAPSTLPSIISKINLDPVSNWSSRSKASTRVTIELLGRPSAIPAS